MAAETFGLAAGVAGFVGLTGQMAEGWLFLKNFVHDVKTAPEEIMSLSAEIRDIDSTAKEIGEAIQLSHQLGINIDYKPALTRCYDMIEAVGKLIAKDVARFNDGNRSWWRRMKAAARKTQVSEWMDKLERAKTHLIIVQGNLSSAMQRIENSVIVSTQTSVRSSHQMLAGMDITVNNVHDQGQRLEIALTEAIQLLKSLSRDKMPPNSRESRLQNEVSNDSTIIQATYDAEPSSDGIMQRQHTGRRLRSTTYGFPSFNITLVQSHQTTNTIESGHDDETQSQNQDLTRATTHTSTVAYLNFRVWPFKKGLRLRYSPSSNLYDPGIDMQLRTLNFVSRDSPIFDACWDLDFEAVKRLFDDRLATPYDTRLDNGDSLVDHTLGRIAWGIEEIRTSNIDRGLRLLKYLVQCTGSKEVKVKNIWFMWLPELLPIFKILDVTANQHLSEMIRIIIYSSIDDPFGDRGRCKLTFREMSSLPFESVLTQDLWDFDWKDLETPSVIFFENDYHILQDPSGRRLDQALLNGNIYEVGFNYPYSAKYQTNSPLHGLLMIAATTDNDNIRQGCWNRVRILLAEGYDPNFHIGTGPDPHGVILGSISAYGYAKHLNLRDEFETILMEIGYTSSDLLDLQDEEVFSGIPELIDGQMTYMTRMECRRYFLDLLSQNMIGSAMIKGNLSVVDFGNSIGSYDYKCLDGTLYFTEEAYSERLIPGAWEDDEGEDDEEFEIIPGQDFGWWLNWDPQTCLNYNTGQVSEDNETVIDYPGQYRHNHYAGQWRTWEDDGSAWEDDDSAWEDVESASEDDESV